MDIIILGVLMVKHSTIYEIREFVGNYLSSISSNSTGSIQAGIKKLLEKEMISFHEVVENGINKKVYSITKKGKKQFIDSLSVPMLYKEKNMELNKLFFMGFIDKKVQIDSVRNYIHELEKELNDLNKINEVLSPRYQINQEYVDEIKQNSGAPELLTENRVYDIATFQYAVLDFGIDKAKFEIEWFNKLKEKLEKEDRNNDSK